MQLNHDRLAKNPCTLRRRWGAMLARLKPTTRFNEEELESLCFVFHKLTRGSKGRMSRKDFIEVLHNSLDMTNTANADYSYKQFDPNNNSYIGIEDWCRGMSVVLRGTLDDKIQHCFKTYNRYDDDEGLKRKNVLWMASENWRGSPDTDIVHIEELLETIMSSIASDTEKGITLADYSAAVKRCPMLLEFLGEVLPSRPSVTTFLSTMMPVAKAYAYCPEYRTGRGEEAKSASRAYGVPSVSEEVVHRLGGSHNMVPRIASDQTPV